MKSKFLLVIGFLFSLQSFSQHCPWDCFGVSMFQTDLSPSEIKKLDPVLVDANKMQIVDTMYGTGLPTYDSCVFLLYKDFKNRYTEKIKVHNWYGYYTMLDFAEGYYIVHYSFCRWQDKELFIRYNDPEKRGGFKYIPVTADQRVHVHNYNSQINSKHFDDIRKDIQDKVLDINRNDWK